MLPISVHMFDLLSILRGVFSGNPLVSDIAANLSKTLSILYLSLGSTFNRPPRRKTQQIKTCYYLTNNPLITPPKK